MLHLSPNLAKVWAYENTHGKVERWRRESEEKLGVKSQRDKTSLISRNQALNLRILTHTTICKVTQNKIKIKKINKYNQR